MSVSSSKKEVVSRSFLNYAAKSLERELNALHAGMGAKIRAMGLEGKVDFVVDSSGVDKEFSVRWVVDPESVKVVK